jgi:septal ring-binding cell division protein DamX
VQLAAARGVQGFTAYRTQLGIAVEDTFVIEVRRNGESWWLMLWRDFPNLESARTAVASLPSKPQGIWPRRLAPLQAEVRATGH